MQFHLVSERYINIRNDFHFGDLLLLPVSLSSLRSGVHVLLLLCDLPLTAWVCLYEFQFTLSRVVIGRSADIQDHLISSVRPVPKRPGWKGGGGGLWFLPGGRAWRDNARHPQYCYSAVLFLTHSWQCLSPWLLPFWLFLLIAFGSHMETQFKFFSMCFLVLEKADQVFND